MLYLFYYTEYPISTTNFTVVRHCPVTFKIVTRPIDQSDCWKLTWGIITLNSILGREKSFSFRREIKWYNLAFKLISLNSISRWYHFENYVISPSFSKWYQLVWTAKWYHLEYEVISHWKLGDITLDHSDITLKIRWYHLAFNVISLNSKWYHLQPRWYHLEARWYHLEARWYHLEPRWYHIES